MLNELHTNTQYKSPRNPCASQRERAMRHMKVYDLIIHLVLTCELGVERSPPVDAPQARSLIDPNKFTCS